MRLKNNNNQARPFVKWAGGKGQLLNEIRKVVPANLRDRKEVIYVEPFVGGGAVLFWILGEYHNITHTIINDINMELICTYRVIKSQVSILIDMLQKIQEEYIALDQDDRKIFFLQKREIFNSKHISDVETATLFIFLNKTCFNGLYRVNSKGMFNVPYGKYINPKICDRENLLACSNLLKNAEILCGDFAETLRYASANSLFYIDPPYKPLSNTSCFTSYSASGFDESDQIRLKNFCEKIAYEGAMFIESNSDPKNVDPSANFFDDLYEKYKIKRTMASRMINSKPLKRGPLSEIIISNCP